jgi:hypothetical protein
MNQMGRSLNLITVDTRWLLRCCCIHAGPEDYRTLTRNLTQSESYNPRSPTTVKRQPSPTDSLWPWATRRGSISVSLLIRAPRFGFSDLLKDPIIEWDKTGGQTRPSPWSSCCCYLRPRNSGYKRQCVCETKTDD